MHLSRRTGPQRQFALLALHFRNHFTAYRNHIIRAAAQDLCALLADRPTPPALPRPTRLAGRRGRGAAAGPAEPPPHRHSRPESAPGAGAGPPAGPAAARRFASPGRPARCVRGEQHRDAAVPPLSAADPDAGSARRQVERLAECCWLLDCMAVE